MKCFNTLTFAFFRITRPSSVDGPYGGMIALLKGERKGVFVLLIPGSSSKPILSSALPKKVKVDPSKKPKAFRDVMKEEMKKRGVERRAVEAARKRKSSSSQELGPGEPQQHVSKGNQPKPKDKLEGSFDRLQGTEEKNLNGESKLTGEQRVSLKNSASVETLSDKVTLANGEKGIKEVSLKGAGSGGPSLKGMVTKNQEPFLEKGPEVASLDSKILEGQVSLLSKDSSGALIKPEVQISKPNIEMQSNIKMQSNTDLAKALSQLESSGANIDVQKLLQQNSQGSVVGPQVMVEVAPKAITPFSQNSASGAIQATAVGVEALGLGDQGSEGFENPEFGGRQPATTNTFGAVSSEQSTLQNTNNSFTQALSEAQGAEAGEGIDNMPSIVRQVRTFIKDGGGSMNIELSPEGMGNINLKVAVDSGQVKVEMLADNPAAKRALEDGLMDMKASLEGQQLTVDNLKVEFSKDYDRDFTQNENFMKDQENRDDAQQFMEQFQKDREERVNSLFSGVESYLREPKGPELGFGGANRYLGENKGRSVNLIA